MKYIYTLSTEQLKRVKERNERYLAMHLAEYRADRLGLNGYKVRAYIKEEYKIINACNLALKARA